MIEFRIGNRITYIGDHVKDFTYEELEDAFKGKLDYVALAKQLGIKKQRKPFKKKEEE